MSHELRTPLNAIMGFSDVMRGRLFGPLSDRYTEYAQLIHESGAHLLDLINDILDMSKIEADRYQLSLEDFDAREAVSAALRLMRVQADAAGVQLRGVLPPGPLEVRADRRAVKQIALNLLANALKFTPHGGQVTVTAQGSGDTLELVVADTGIGIAPDDLERLGRPYEQAGDPAQNARGTGLGLSLVRAFAGLHGGELSIESVLGEGATFSVRLPVLIRAGAARLPADPSLLGDNVVAFNPQR
jgi:cell cycle sensor histidine kinase DivJ